jgi:protein gp37
MRLFCTTFVSGNLPLPQCLTQLEAMSENSAIEWTDTTWNPVTGCTKISSGCDNCYAERFSERFRGVKRHPFSTGFDLTLRPNRLQQPLDWKRPRMVFVNSMSDLFHKEISREYISAVFDTMEKADWHIYQVLTKRSSLMQRFINARYKERAAPHHIWFGVSVENAEATSRIAHLRKAQAAIRFLSIEPLIAPIGELDLQGIDWVIVGGESGWGARPMLAEWVIDIRDQCVSAGVAFFFKQWGGRSPKARGRLLDGREWNQFPATLAPPQIHLQVPA